MAVNRDIPRTIDSCLSTAIDQLAASIAPERIVLFGSYAHGTPRADSDIDLLLVMPDADFDRRRLLKQAYRALKGIEHPIDLLIYSQSELEGLSGSAWHVAGAAITQGIVLYEAPGCH